jgi:hypothetical protein
LPVRTSKTGSGTMSKRTIGIQRDILEGWDVVSY